MISNSRLADRQIGESIDLQIGGLAELGMAQEWIMSFARCCSYPIDC